MLWYMLVVKGNLELTVAMIRAPIVCRIEQVFLELEFDTTKSFGSYIFLSLCYNILTEFNRNLFLKNLIKVSK